MDITPCLNSSTTHNEDLVDVEVLIVRIVQAVSSDEQPEFNRVIPPVKKINTAKFRQVVRRNTECSSALSWEDAVILAVVVSGQ